VFQAVSCFACFCLPTLRRQAEATFDNGSWPVEGRYPTAAAADDRLYCSSCDWHCTLEAQMRSHLSSNRHKLKLLVQQVCLTLSKSVTYCISIITATHLTKSTLILQAVATQLKCPLAGKLSPF